RRIQHLQHRVVPQGFGGTTRKRLRLRWTIQQSLNLRKDQRLRQARRRFRDRRVQERLLFGMPFVEEESVESAPRGHASRDGRRSEPGALEKDQEPRDVHAREGRRIVTSLCLEVGAQLVEIVAITLQRIDRAAAFRNESVEVPIDKLGIRQTTFSGET